MTSPPLDVQSLVAFDFDERRADCDIVDSDPLLPTRSTAIERISLAADIGVRDIWEITCSLETRRRLQYAHFRLRNDRHAVCAKVEKVKNYGLWLN